MKTKIKWEKNFIRTRCYAQIDDMYMGQIEYPRHVVIYKTMYNPMVNGNSQSKCNRREIARNRYKVQYQYSIQIITPN